MKNFSNKQKANETRELTRDFLPTDQESMDYTKDTTNRQEAQAVIDKLNKIPIKTSCVAWVDGQPCRITSTRDSSKFVDAWTNNGKRIMKEGSPATDTEDRVPSEWENKMHYGRKRGYTLDETPTMAFKSSGHLPPHYYQDETALEAYVASLTKES